MIRRFDEILLSKASKFSIDQINKELESYIKLTQHIESQEVTKAEIDQMHNRLDIMGTEINEMNERIIREIKNAVK